MGLECLTLTFIPSIYDIHVGKYSSPMEHLRCSSTKKSHSKKSRNSHHDVGSMDTAYGWPVVLFKKTLNISRMDG